MARDFTVSVYKKLLGQLVKAGYAFQTFKDFVRQPAQKTILLRHDVDDRKLHSLQFARIQHELGIVGTYYFRIIPQSFDEEVIKEIASMGHEIGYHYEDMDFAGGDPEKAIQLFEKNLEKLRNVADIKTISMHGSPLSKHNNRDLWKHYDYRDYGILAEPYFDLDFNKVLYLTDTGRRWDGEKVSVRDKVQGAGYRVLDAGDSGKCVSGSRSDTLNESKRQNAQRSKLLNSSTSTPLSKAYSFRSTQEIINACKSGNLPDQIMFNFHPQRWTDNKILWIQELLMQNVKNVVKRGVVRWRSW